MIGKQIFYEGRVQGVGFRFTVKQIARGFDVIGWVRNLDDGRVELQATGDAAEVDAFLDAIAESELKSHIKTECYSRHSTSARHARLRDCAVKSGDPLHARWRRSPFHPASERAPR